MKQLYFCRHGLSLLNQQGLWSGSLDTLFVDKGRKQAKLAGAYAKSLVVNYIVCSPLSRAVETAQIIAKAISYPVEKMKLTLQLSSAISDFWRVSHGA